MIEIIELLDSDDEAEAKVVVHRKEDEKIQPVEDKRGNDDVRITGADGLIYPSFFSFCRTNARERSRPFLPTPDGLFFFYLFPYDIGRGWGCLVLKSQSF